MFRLENAQVKTAIYARVSTEEQNPEVQLEELRRYCHARNWIIVNEIVDHGYSGASSNRPGLKQLNALVHTRQIDAVVVVRIDRLFRSLKDLIFTIEDYKASGINFVSLKDAINLDSPSGKMLFHLTACFAEFERSLLSDRTKAGLAEAKRRGKRLGRPSAPAFVPHTILHLRRQGMSYRDICRRTGYSMGMVTRTIQAHLKGPG